MKISWQTIGQMPEENLKEMQNEKVRFLMRTLVPMHPFYRKLYEQKGIDYRKIETVDDLQKLPFSSKYDILPTDEEPRRPRDFILQPNEELIKKVYPKSELIKMLAKKIMGKNIKEELEYEYKPVHTHFTTGRSTNQIPFLYTRHDLDLLKETGGRLFQVVGAIKDDIALNAFPYAPHLAFWLAFYAITGSGVLGLQSGGGKILGTEKIMAAVEKMKATILIAIPGYGYHLLRIAAGKKKDFSALKIFVSGGERLSPGLRAKLKELLASLGAKDTRILATYALTEAKTAWAQCHENSGYHLYPDLEFIELVDKDGNRVKAGEKGEIVYTNLGWRGSMVIRYRTGDICDGIEYAPCQYCGRTVPRLNYNIERQSDYKEFHLTKIKGELVNLNVFYSIINEFSEIAEWQVEIGKVNNDPFELDEIRINIAAEEGSDERKIDHELGQRLFSGLSVAPKIRFYKLDELTKMLGLDSELKEKRIIDARPK
ncbi:phenylacetate--CoA ligase family protein [Patescibacteria group bacterium]|nr:MAG: phenylacetate--CoA ligase family protein [Patescibacteria group bacterium]